VSLDIYQERVFEVGQTVRCVDPSGCTLTLTKGHEYKVEAYKRRGRADNGFRFPAYVFVKNDRGLSGVYHTYRFEALDPTQTRVESQP
jgi:hypothetical protein